MLVSLFRFRNTFAYLCVAIASAHCCFAQAWTKDPTTWWPDPSTGLMWTGQAHGSPHPDPKLQSGTSVLGRNGLDWQQAQDYCVDLTLGGLGGWRLASLDDFRTVIEVRDTAVASARYRGEPKALASMDDAEASGRWDSIYIRGGIDTFGNMMIWTSTLSPTDPKSAWVVEIGAAWPHRKNSTENPSIYLAEVNHSFMGALCVRPMESKLLAIAKDASVDHPVHDVETLRALIPLNKARLAYQAGNYQESIAQAEIAISTNTDPATANWGIGISYGRLGQWDKAIANLQSSLLIDKNYEDAQAALKWAKDGLKLAKKGKLPKEPNPAWM